MRGQISLGFPNHTPVTSRRFETSLNNTSLGKGVILFNANLFKTKNIPAILHNETAVEYIFHIVIQRRARS